LSKLTTLVFSGIIAPTAFDVTIKPGIIPVIVGELSISKSFWFKAPDVVVAVVIFKLKSNLGVTLTL